MIEIWRPTTVLHRSYEPRPTKAELVYQALRHDIVTLALQPGMVIDKQTVCRRLDVSRFPVSEALTRLSREGLVIIEPQRGSFVARLDVQMLESAVFMRIAIETEACRVVATRPGVGQLLEKLRASLAKQQQTRDLNDTEGLHAEDEAFHALLVSELGLPRVQAYDQVAGAHLERLRRLTFPAARSTDLLEEHGRIIEALARADSGAAAEAMRDHLNHTKAALEVLVQTRPELFGA